MYRIRITKKIIFSTLVILGFFVGAITVLAADMIKSLDFLAGHSAGQISAATTTDFTVYIGDNLSGVLQPVKSVFIQISGVYTGGGTLGVSLNSDPASLQSYDLPSVSHPTKFEILYKDPANIMSPVSAGSYNYSLNIDPSGVVISGFSAVARITVRYSADACDDGQPSSEKIKSTDFLVLSNDTQISLSASEQFQIYLGDDLTGITNPVKSIFFEVSGVYTGGGTLGISLNSDPATLQTFELPSVSVPTPFTINYSDPNNTINPVSAGIYSYQFDLNPSGVVLSGVSAVAHLTHRYKPPACGSGYAPFGDLTSTIIDIPSAGISPAYNSISWRGALGGPLQNAGKVKFRFAASNDPSGPWNDADFIGGADCNSTGWFETAGPDSPVEIKCFNQLNNKRYFRYKVRICSDDCQVSGDYTPNVDDIVISWSP
jgi:hypothetical protein